MTLYYQQGLAGTTVDQITAAAGVAKGTFYNYFLTREDLLVAALQLSQGQDAPAWHASTFELPGVYERLCHVAGWAVAWVTAFPELAMAWMKERLGRGMAETYSGFDQLIADVIAAGQASGEVAADRSAEELTADVEGLILIHVSGWYHGGRTADLTASINRALRTYIEGAGGRK